MKDKIRGDMDLACNSTLVKIPADIEVHTFGLVCAEEQGENVFLKSLIQIIMTEFFSYLS